MPTSTGDRAVSPPGEPRTTRRRRGFLRRAVGAPEMALCLAVLLVGGACREGPRSGGEDGEASPSGPWSGAVFVPEEWNGSSAPWIPGEAARRHLTASVRFPLGDATDPDGWRPMEGNRVRLERAGTVGLAIPGDGRDRVVGFRVGAPWLGSGSWTVRVQEWSAAGGLLPVALLDRDRPRLQGHEVGEDARGLSLTVQLGGSPWIELQELTLEGPSVEADGRARPETEEAAPRPDLVLVVQDAARADRVGAYGYERATTPNLDRLAGEGVLFRRAYSECPHTSCSVAGLLTGRAMVPYSPPSGPVDGELPRLARRLRDAGYHTAAVAANPNLSARRRLHLGFDAFEETWGEVKAPPPTEPRARALRRLFHRVTQVGPGIRNRRLETIGAWIQGVPVDAPELLGVGPESGMAEKLPSVREELGAGLPSGPLSNEEIMDALRRAVARVTRQPPRLVIEETRRVTDRALDLLAEAPGDRPLFLLVHMVPPHEPYVPASSTTFHDPDYEGPVEIGLLHVRALAGLEKTLDPDDVEQLSALYDGNFRRGDEELGRLLSAFRDRSRWDRTAVVVTSDHGEAFMEHGEISHGNDIFEEEVRIPLVIRPPSDGVAPEVREELASLLDLYPTFLGLAGLPPDPGAWGEDLLAPELGGDRVLFLRYTRGFGAVAGDWKLVVDLRDRAVPRLFHLRRDPREQRNVAREQPERVAVLTALLKRFLAMRELSSVPAASGEMSPEERRRLEALGYLG